MPFIRLRDLAFFLALVFSTPALAWNEFGHMLIAELALQKLDPKLQRKIELQAFSLVKQQSSERRLYLMRAYPDSSAFAQLAVFADSHKRQTLAELYQIYDQSMPASYADQANENTSKWHYKNQAYLPASVASSTELGSSAHNPPAINTADLVNDGILDPEGFQSAPVASLNSKKHCDLSEPVDVAWAIEQSKQAFIEAKTESDQLLPLAFLIHFVGDAHQPLHAISRVDENCKSDRGGNDFCVVYRGSSISCETNLHAFWDAGVGFFESFDRLSDARDFVARVEVDDIQAKNLNPDDWLAENFRQARFVYSIKEGSGGDSYYTEEAQIIAYERIAIAAERLARILNTLYY